MSLKPLAELERLRLAFGPGIARRKLELLDRLARARLPTAQAVRRFHELLCVLCAYPDDAELHARVRGLLESFATRPDLRAHRKALADSGIAGTAIHYRFFAGQAQWLARRWPAQLRLDRRDAQAGARLAKLLPPLLTPAETQALGELKLPGYAALDRVRGPGETDAVFLLRRIAALPGSSYLRESWSDTLDASYVLDPGPESPSRTTAQFRTAPRVYRQAPPTRQRPDLRAELARPPRSLRRLAPRDAAAVIDLARGAMVTRARSLEAFSFADPRDAWLIDDGDGLAFAIVGVVPERRHVLASWYGGLTLRNGVPIGYVQSDHLGPSAALSFNTFETFRGGEAAHTFARWLAVLRRLLGATSFSIEPYQLGAHNEEALASGAWWFYRKLGFAPRDAAIEALARDEQARLQRRPGEKTPRAVLRRLAAQHLFFDLDAARPYPLVPLGALGLAAGAALSTLAGADRERAVGGIAATLMRQCGLASLHSWSADERAAWRRMAPVLALLGAEHWTSPQRAALAELVRAKGGRSERDFVMRFIAHRRLNLALARWSPEPSL